MVYGACMKLILLLLFTSCSLRAQDARKSVSKGALIEGIFILNNKQREVKEAIQVFKKELTECFSVHKEVLPKNFLSPQERLEAYHCKLKQLIYPWYIDELSRLYEQGQKDIKELERDEVPQADIFDAFIQRAFLLHQKIASERQLLDALFKVDRLLSEQPKKTTSSRMSWFEKSSPSVPNELQLLEEAKKKVSHLKTQSIIINANLYEGTLPQEVFLDRLSFFKP